MTDREKWRERVRDIRATSMTWWWGWWCMIYRHMIYWMILAYDCKAVIGILLCHKISKNLLRYLLPQCMYTLYSDLNWHCLSGCPSPVGCGCRINQLHLCRGVSPHPHNKCPWYNTKQSDGVAPGFLECGVPFHCSRSQVYSDLKW